MSAAAQLDLFKATGTPSFGDAFDHRARKRAADEQVPGVAALPRTGRELLTQARFSCKECSYDGPADCAEYIEGVAYCRACASQLRTVATHKWGDQSKSKGFWLLRIVRNGERYSCDGDYGMPNQGGYAGIAGRDFATAEEALIEALRDKLRRVAKHLAVYGGGDSMYGKAVLWLQLAQWCIEKAPPPLMGGPDLSAEFAAMREQYDARNAMRCEAIRAGAQDYQDETGGTRLITSL